MQAPLSWLGRRGVDPNSVATSSWRTGGILWRRPPSSSTSAGTNTADGSIPTPRTQRPMRVMGGRRRPGRPQLRQIAELVMELLLHREEVVIGEIFRRLLVALGRFEVAWFLIDFVRRKVNRFAGRHLGSDGLALLDR